jgi:hypothetical protein
VLVLRREEQSAPQLIDRKAVCDGRVVRPGPRGWPIRRHQGGAALGAKRGLPGDVRETRLTMRGGAPGLPASPASVTRARARDYGLSSSVASLYCGSRAISSTSCAYPLSAAIALPRARNPCIHAGLRAEVLTAPYAHTHHRGRPETGCDSRVPWRASPCALSCPWT